MCACVYCTVVLMTCLWLIGNVGEREEMQELPGDTDQAGLQREAVVGDCSQREGADQRPAGERAQQMETTLIMTGALALLFNR